MVEGYTDEEFNEIKKDPSVNLNMYEKFQSYEGEPLNYHKIQHAHHFAYRDNKVKNNAIQK